MIEPVHRLETKPLLTIQWKGFSVVCTLMTTFQSSVILPDWCLRGIFYDVPGEFSNMLFCVFFISPRALAFRGIVLVLSDFILVIDLYTFLYFWDFLCLYYSKGSSLLLFPSLGLYTFLCFPLSWWEHFYQMELESQLLAGYFFFFLLSTSIV